MRAHTICRYCGYYKGREFINVLGKLNKKEKKVREKEIQKSEKEQRVADRPITMEELSKK